MHGSRFGRVLTELLKFLILSEKSKLAFLPPKVTKGIKQEYIVVADTRSTTDDPLYFLVYKACSMLGHIYMWSDDEEENKIIGDLVDILEVMINLRQVDGYRALWSLDSFHLWSSSSQVFWRLARDYANRLLLHRNITDRKMRMTFSEIRIFVEPNDFSPC